MYTKISNYLKKRKYANKYMQVGGIILLPILLISSGCNKEPVVASISDYDRLCQLYTEVRALKYSEAEKEAILSEKVQKQIPEIYQLYRNILSNGRIPEGYFTYKKFSEEKTGKNWSCSSMKKYFHVQ